MAQPVIRKGSRGDAVTRAQENLNLRGFDSGRVDGIFGAKTEKAVRLYQSFRGLAVDGIVGPRTWARLDPPTVRNGSRGPAVTLLQQLLIDNGFDPGDIDGDFGPNTESAVREFQTVFGLEEVDGIVGQKTWAALGS
jgi:peptidoglycan hydrolase-like protein with peptidoglycan-binding domain